MFIPRYSDKNYKKIMWNEIEQIVELNRKLI